MSRLSPESGRATALGVTTLLVLAITLLAGPVFGAASPDSASVAASASTPTEHQMTHTHMTHTDMTHTDDGGYGYATPSPTPTASLSPTATTPGAAGTATPPGGDSTREGATPSGQGPSDPVDALLKGFRTALAFLIEAIQDAVSGLLS